MNVLSSYVSCGVNELAGLTFWNPKFLEKYDPNDSAVRAHNLTVKKVAEVRAANIAKLRQGYTYIFSDAEILGNGIAFAKFIRDHNLGTLTEHGVINNPNSKNDIRVWVFTYNGNKPTKYEAKAA